MIDIFSRKAIHWEVHLTQTGNLARITSPTRTLHGAADTFAPPAHTRRTAEIIPDASLTPLVATRAAQPHPADSRTGREPDLIRTTAEFGTSPEITMLNGAECLRSASTSAVERGNVMTGCIPTHPTN